MTGTVEGFRQIVKNFDRTLASLAARGDVKRDSAYFLANIRGVKTADEFVANDRLFGYAMTAFGLKDMVYAKAFMRKVLNEGLDGDKSFALQLADVRFRDFAETFNFARYGASATAFDRAQQGTVDRYLRIELEAEAGKADEGVRLALYFQRKASGISSIYGLMGDAALYKVIQTSLGLPAAMSGGDIDKQAALIGGKVVIDDFKDPAKLDAFLMNFTARWQVSHGTAVRQIPQIGLGQPVLAAFDNELMLSMQTLNTGRGK